MEPSTITTDEAHGARWGPLRLRRSWAWDLDVGWPRADRLEVFGGLGVFGELEEAPDLLCENCSNVGGTREEELLACVRLVQRPVGECLVEFVLEGDRVLREVQGVYVEAERHGRVTELGDPVERFESTGQADLAPPGPNAP